MMRRLLLWLTARLPVKVIGRPGAPYVEWYHLCTLFGLFRVQIHHFVRSDPDGLHDHPWGWAASMILAGGYLEERRDRDRVRRAGNVYFLSGDTFHRVALREGREAWTLFVHGPYVKHWGFLTPASPNQNGFAPCWHAMQGSHWNYEARARSEHAFDPWPYHRRCRRGRDIRRIRLVREA